MTQAPAPQIFDRRLLRLRLARALRFGADLQPMTVERLPNARFRVTVHEPIALRRTGSRTADLEYGVAQVNAFIETQVRARPREWFWVHKRWANAAYDSLSEPAG